MHWCKLSLNPNLTAQFIKTYCDKLSWDNLSSNSALTIKIIENHLNAAGITHGGYL